jgi:antibiotic biosynthesis monooxygenase (ABM) superfamily enzyme
MLRALVLSVTMVVVLTWLVLPGLTRLFRRWLAPTG